MLEKGTVFVMMKAEPSYGLSDLNKNNADGAGVD